MPNIDTLSITFSSKGTETAVKNIKAMGYAVRNLAACVKSIDAGKLSGFVSAMETLKKSVPTEAQTNRMVSFAGAVGSLNSAIGSANIGSFAKDMSTLGTAVNAFKKSSVNSITSAVAAMQNLGTATKQTAQTVNNVTPKNPAIPKMQNVASPATNVQEVVASLDKVQVKAKGVQAILAKMGVFVPTKQFKDLEQNAEKVRAKYDEVRQTLQKGLNEGSVTKGDSTYKKKMAELDALRNKYDELIQKQEELAREGGRFTLANGLKQALSSAKAMDSSFRSLQSAMGAVSGKFKSIISKVRSFGSQTKKTAHETISLTDAAKKLSNELLRVSKMLKLMVTRMALRAVIKEVGNGFKSLALHSEEFNNSMSSLINGSKKLGYSFAAMVSPLINALAPAIVYVINLLTQLVNIIQQVFGALTGATTWNKAKDFTESWADNIEAANKGAKELKKTVLGFDELNQLQDNKNSGGGGSDITDMFDTQQIDPKWKSLADTIKKYAQKLFDPIKKAWEKVGDFVKKSWKYAMDEVLKLGSSVARDFWKMWEQKATQQIFENILTIIGYIGVTVGNLARQFRKAWDENHTGYKILCNIRDVVLTITEHFKNMAKATADWADTLDFSPVLKKFNEWLGSIKPVVDNLMGVIEDFYTTVILPLTKWAVEEGAPQLLQVFIDFNNKVDWEGLREKLKTLWEHLEPFMETVGEGLIIFINDCAQALANFLNSQEFEDFLKAIEDWMDSVTPQDVADGLKAIAKAIIGFAIGKAVIDGLVAIAGFLKLVASLAPLLKLTIAIGVAYAGVKLGGLLGKWLTGDKVYDEYTIPVMIKWFAEETPKFFDDFTGTFKEWADAWITMRNEADLFVRIIARLAEGLLAPVIDAYSLIKGIKDGTDEAAKSTSNFKDKLSELSNNAKSASTETDGLKRSFSGAYGEIKNTNTVAENAKTTFGKVYGELKNTNVEADNASKSFSNVYSGLQNVNEQASSISGSFSNIYTGLKTTATESDNTSTSFGKLCDSMKTASTGASDMQRQVSTSFGAILTDSKKITVDVPNEVAGAQQKLSGTWQTLSKDTNTSMGEVKKSVDDSMKDVNKSLDTVKDAMSEKEWTFDGVGNGLTKTFEKAKEGIKSVWNSIAEKLNGEHSIGEGKLNIHLPKFAGGGFVEDGLFLANHHELVGTFSNGKTAVANNGQIIAGIESGVYSAMSKVMSQTSGNSQYIANEIIVDGDVIARSISKAQDRQNRRFSPATT